MGFIRKIMGVKAAPPAPKYAVDPDRAKRMAAAAASAKNRPTGRSGLKNDLDDDDGQARSGIVI